MSKQKKRAQKLSRVERAQKQVDKARAKLRLARQIEKAVAESKTLNG